MDDETPPQRITRSRATARATTTEPEVKIATAAAKARATRNTTVATTKRKTRADDTLADTYNNEDIDLDDGDKMNAPPVKPKVTRSRKKANQLDSETHFEVEAGGPVESSAAVTGPAKPARGRPRKVVEASQQNEVPKATRGRPRRVATAEEPVVKAVAETLKKTTRSRVNAAQQLNNDAVMEPVTKAGSGRPAALTRAMAAPKKSMKLDRPEQQDKENVIPIGSRNGKGKDNEAPTGLRARPVRKPPIGIRSGPGRPKAADIDRKLPLTSKKATQMATAKENAPDDELAIMEQTPMKPLATSPLKAPGCVIGSSRKLEFTASIPTVGVGAQGLCASSMGSPARRPPPSPFKDFLRVSPKKINIGDSTMASPFKPSMPASSEKFSPIKTSLLQSPARRPRSPTKFFTVSSPTRNKLNPGETLKVAPFNISTFNATPKPINKTFSPSRQPLPSSISENLTGDTTSNGLYMDASAIVPFPGRLSCILSRDADPALQHSCDRIHLPQTPELGGDMLGEREDSFNPQVFDAMAIDEVQQPTDSIKQRSTTPNNSPPRYSIGNFALHAVQGPFESSDSEDELASGSPTYSPAPLKAFRNAQKDFTVPSTPTPANNINKMPRTAVIPRSSNKVFHSAPHSQSARASKNGGVIAPLIRRFDDCISAFTASDSSFSSEKAVQLDPGSGLMPAATIEFQAIAQPSPAKVSFFEDAISVSGAAGEIENAAVESEGMNDDVDALDFAPATLDEEDLALAAEADEMSLISDHVDEYAMEMGELLNQSVCGDVRALSEASQDYGDENAVPIDQDQSSIDPVLLALDTKQLDTTSVFIAQEVSTPVRFLGNRSRVFHTVSKVPLKPPAEDSPLKVNHKSASASRLLADRQAPLPESFLVPQLPVFASPGVGTTTQSNNWSTATTPVRTPRRHLNDQILRGAIVFVDVHTSEGADASAVFVELLVQMGAKCVKHWSWNPNSLNFSDVESGSQGGDKDQATNSNGKIGITHVVFKDGGKRTLEKVRESNGLVICVGVGWVLDCERQNTWLAESAYAVDTAIVPRGGHRRRKSMEPRSIQKMNGSLSCLPSATVTPRSVSASYGSPQTREFQNHPETPGTKSRSARRKSTLWIRSPSSDGDGDRIDTDGGLLLSPVPATPAPEMLSAYAELDDSSSDGAVTPYYLKRDRLVQRTCPPKRSSATAGERSTGPAAFDTSGDVDYHADEGGPRGILMQRLLLARRKSLQWAPKVGSPLAKGVFGA